MPWWSGSNLTLATTAASGAVNGATVRWVDLYKSCTSRFRPRAAGIRDALFGSNWMRRLACYPLPSVGWPVERGEVGSVLICAACGKARILYLENHARTTGSTEIRIISLRVGVRTRPARSAEMLVCSVATVLLACFSVLKTLACYVSYATSKCACSRLEHDDATSPRFFTLDRPRHRFFLLLGLMLIEHQASRAGALFRQLLPVVGAPVERVDTRSIIA